MATKQRPRIAVLDDYQGIALTAADWRDIQSRAELVVFDRRFRSDDELVEALQSFDILCLMRERTAFPRPIIERLSRLSALIYTGVRNRTIDVEAATERGIAVLNTGVDPHPSATMELTWALILAAARQIPAADRSMHAGHWLNGVPAGTVLAGKVIGIIGLGKVGRQVARIAKAFGMEVVAWSQNLTRDQALEGGATLVGKEELLQSADVISLHVVLSERTRKLIGAQDFHAMKPTAILVNCARGPLVDEDALLDALRNRRIAGAALDVYDVEPLPADHPLRSLPNVILTPHLGYVTTEVYQVYYKGVVDRLESLLKGPVPHR